MNVNEIVNVSIGLTAVPASISSFSEALLLVDHPDVPIDVKYRYVTRSDHTTLLTASTDQAEWCATLWGQNYNPARAAIGRWISAATASYAVCPNATSVVATWTALTNTGQVGIKEGASAAVDINPDFTGDTSMTDVAASFQAAIVAAAGITASYTCTLDALDRITFTSDNTGSSADAVTLTTPAAGTDLTGSAYLGTETSVAGYDIETMGTALARIFNVNNVPFVCCQRGASIAQAVAFSTSVNALDKICIIVDDDSDAKAVSSASIGYQVKALTHNKTYMIYTEHTTTIGAAANQYPDAALIGEVMSRLDKEGALNMALNGLSGVSESGLDIDLTTVIPLTSTERTNLETNGYDYLVEPSNITHLVHGLAAGGNELRVMIGKAYMATKISEDIYAYMIANEVVTFSDPDIQAIKSICAYWVAEMVDRGLLDETTIVWDFPAAADFTSTQKASHTMTLSEVLVVDVLSAVNDITITMSFSI
jgi:hypothetical protein